MKKIFTSLAVALIASAAYSQVITQNAVPNTVATTGSVACGSQANGYTADNSYYRVFKLSDYGINYNYNITNIAFGVQTANTTFPVEVNLYTLAGTFPTGTPTLLGTANVNVAPANVGQMVSTGATLSQVVPAGGTFVVEIYHDGSTATPPQSFYLGTHPGAQTGPSYLSSETCGIDTPIATGTGALAGFASARWVMTITGQNTLGVTEVINSKDLQIFPNPVKDVLKFRFGNSLKSEGIDIYDMNGRVITSISNNKNVNEVNVSSFTKGTYILKVKASDGKVYVQKIIKE
ncbi:MULTISPECIES: T9SS type A sorting domain-containing protein [Chryseobacterium]|uniref:T9SS type A sorting domain-containing protein n=1 Tax=Chryseobacterium TaxID=59732 RepID=UPI002358FAC8|nr:MULTISPECIES: T9SS type A sorting domain-containing protein [unclassified Chryseobacterium]MDC8104191.1 T9SS type A sorting domain-containing protein [Chryseobacterium sp. B21-037]MDQ1803800.1 T9SS type A sorting domain-containing protein [Chryseobacterium sp. CKR4-1]